MKAIFSLIKIYNQIYSKLNVNKNNKNKKKSRHNKFNSLKGESLKFNSKRI